MDAQNADPKTLEGSLANPPLEDLGGEPAPVEPAAPTPAAGTPAAPTPAPAPAVPASLLAVHEVPVKVKVVLGRARMQIQKLLEMQAGTVVELDRRVGEPVDVYVNDRLIARGEVVMIDSSLGVTLTEVVRQEA